VAQSGAERSFGKPEKHNSVQSGEFLRCAQDDEATLVFRSAGIKNTKLIHVPAYPLCSDLFWRRWLDLVLSVFACAAGGYKPTRHSE
jgi:hypothetical protein